MRSMIHATAWCLIGLLTMQCATSEREKDLQQFVGNHIQTVRPILRKMNLAYWEAANTGKKEAYDTYSEAQIRLRGICSDPEAFTTIKSALENGRITDPLLRRQLEILYNQYLGNQIDSVLMRRIVGLESEIDQTFSAFRGTIRGRKVSASGIHEILKNETDGKTRRLAWEASKQVGPMISGSLRKLIRLRNQAAESVGFENYHTMQLTLSEQDAEELTQIFDALHGLTASSFNAMKQDLDSVLAREYGISPDDMQPWHYHDPFFQETPLVYHVDLDAFYRDRDIRMLAERYFAKTGLDVSGILANSDLYEREGKNPHAFCTDIDREGDVRTLCNLKNNERWMETLLHELGHGVYNMYQDPDTPFLLREPAHAFTTEAVAMFFGRMSRDPGWMQSMLALDDGTMSRIRPVLARYAEMKQLIFARWAMVMFHFEKQLYADPDADLNALWWRLVEKYQGIRKPEGRDAPDWAAKIHVALYPCYYHNYLLGELLASQFQHAITARQLRVADPGIGDYFREQVFEAGNRMHWNDMIARSTGEQLNPRHFVAEFVQE